MVSILLSWPNGVFIKSSEFLATPFLGPCVTPLLFVLRLIPLVLSAYFTADQMRFAQSESVYLHQLHARVVELMGDDIPLFSFTNPSFLSHTFDMPMGGLADPPIIVNLLNAIKLTGPFVAFRSGCLADPNFKWIVSYPSSPFPSNFKSFQSAALSALSSGLKCKDLAAHLSTKLAVTLKPLYSVEDLPRQWGRATIECLSSVSSYIKMCWLKSVAGAWCTGVRLQTHKGRGCIFGCVDTRDELCHYLICPALWQIARDTLGIQEASVLILHRLCISEPSPVKLKILAFCHALYHACINDAHCIAADGVPRCSSIVQHRASENASFCLQLVGGR
jgi:hypothetical protein